VFIQNKSLIIENKDSKKTQILYSISPIIPHNSVEVKGAVIVFQDITYKEKMEQELAKQEKLKSIGVLAGGIAHDFNNFLASILGNITLARDTKDEIELNNLLIESENAIDRATSLTKELMTFSKGGEPSFEIVNNIDELINDYIIFALRGSNIKINKNIPTNKKISNCRIDKNQISQVIHNIIINAKHSMPYGGEIFYTIENIELSNEEIIYKHKIEAGKYIKISIRDTGIGIREEILPNIFDPYFTTKTYGTGLGLSISYSIIKKHNGEIIIKSEVNKGTEIEILLPSTDEEITINKLKTTNQNINDRVLTILIMDDDEMILKILGKIINKLGHKVVSCLNGEEALSIYKEYNILNKKIDLVITDLTIPNGMGGEELAQKILLIDENARLIVSSGYYNSPIISNYGNYGFKAILPKPYKIEEVMNAISVAVL
jgi:signal transduction histidine kinase/CheY-like chemotaxis protein